MVFKTKDFKLNNLLSHYIRLNFPNSAFMINFSASKYPGTYQQIITWRWWAQLSSAFGSGTDRLARSPPSLLLSTPWWLLVSPLTVKNCLAYCCMILSEWFYLSCSTHFSIFFCMRSLILLFNFCCKSLLINVRFILRYIQLCYNVQTNYASMYHDFLKALHTVMFYTIQ